MKRPIRVLLAKLGLDGHDRGVKVVARAFRDAGFEVIYTGIKKGSEQVAQAAVQEDVSLIGVSILSGAHNTLIPKLITALKERNGVDIPIVIGGIIPEDDIPGLKELGVVQVFGPGSNTQEIVEFVKDLLGR